VLKLGVLEPSKSLRAGSLENLRGFKERRAKNKGRGAREGRYVSGDVLL